MHPRSVSYTDDHQHISTVFIVYLLAMSYLIISAQLKSQLSYFLHVHLFPVVSRLKQTSLWNLNLQWHMLLLSTLMMRGICIGQCVCVCVCVCASILFWVRTRVFFDGRYHIQNRSANRSWVVAAMLFGQSPSPKVLFVTFSPCFVGCVFSCFRSVLIWSSLIFPAGLTHCSTTADLTGAMFQTAPHFPAASTCAVGGGRKVVLVLVHIFINKYLHYRAEKQWEKKTTAVRWNYGSPSGRSAVCSDTEDELC